MCHMCSGLDVWYLLPIATDDAISPLRALLWEVRYRTKTFNIRWSSWTRDELLEWHYSWLARREKQSAVCGMQYGSEICLLASTPTLCKWCKHLQLQLQGSKRPYATTWPICEGSLSTPSMCLFVVNDHQWFQLHSAFSAKRMMVDDNDHIIAHHHIHPQHKCTHTYTHACTHTHTRTHTH